MKPPIQRLSSCAMPAAAVALLVAGCATNKMTDSGFIGNGTRLQPSQYKNVSLYRSAELKVSEIASIVIDEPVIMGDSKRLAALSAEDKKELLGFLRTELSTRFGKITPQAGASKVVKLRSALTDFDAPNRGVNAATTLLVGPVTTGGASLEVKLMSTEGGQPLIAAACFETGNALKNFSASYTLLGHAKVAIGQCLDRFVAAYEQRPLQGD